MYRYTNPGTVQYCNLNFPQLLKLQQCVKKKKSSLSGGSRTRLDWDDDAPSRGPTTLAAALGGGRVPLGPAENSHRKKTTTLPEDAPLMPWCHCTSSLRLS